MLQDIITRSGVTYELVSHIPRVRNRYQHGFNDILIVLSVRLCEKMGGSFETLQCAFLGVHVVFSPVRVRMASLVSLKSMLVCLRSQLYHNVGNCMGSVFVIIMCK